MHLTLLILLTATSLYSQISGSVVDAKTNQPIAGVNITGGNTGTAADNEGRFSIAVQEGDELTFSHIGYSIISTKAFDGMSVKLKAIILRSLEIVVRA